MEKGLVVLGLRTARTGFRSRGGGARIGVVRICPGGHLAAALLVVGPDCRALLHWWYTRLARRGRRAGSIPVGGWDRCRLLRADPAIGWCISHLCHLRSHGNGGDTRDVRIPEHYRAPGWCGDDQRGNRSQHRGRSGTSQCPQRSADRALRSQRAVSSRPADCNSGVCERLAPRVGNKRAASRLTAAAPDGRCVRPERALDEGHNDFRRSALASPPRRWARGSHRRGCRRRRYPAVGRFGIGEYQASIGAAVGRPVHGDVSVVVLALPRAGIGMAAVDSRSAPYECPCQRIAGRSLGAGSVGGTARPRKRTAPSRSIEPTRRTPPATRSRRVIEPTRSCSRERAAHSER